MERFEQIELQVLTGTHENALGLSHPAMVEKLEISEEQQSRIRRLSLGYEKESKLRFEKIFEARELLAEEFKSELNSVLDDAQKEKLKSLRK